jgi:Putative MetA-pathway of phenol degradation
VRAAGRLAAGLALLLAAWPAAAAPIRANTPGTGVYQGSGVLTGVTVDRSSVAGADVVSLAAFAELRYTPATHWVFGLRVPYVENRLDPPGAETVSASGLGDVVVTAKHRFYRAVGPWRDRHAALEVGVKLPTGETGVPLSPGLPADLQSRLRPGTGSTDFLVDLVYQQARRRWGAAADLAYRANGEGTTGLRAGDEVRLNGSLQYILLPRIYTRPGKELFVLLEATALRRQADHRHGARLAGTDSTELLLAPGVQYVATEQLFLDLSVQVPVWRETGRQGPRSRWNGLVQLRYAF